MCHYLAHIIKNIRRIPPPAKGTSFSKLFTPGSLKVEAKQNRVLRKLVTLHRPRASYGMISGSKNRLQNQGQWSRMTLWMRYWYMSRWQKMAAKNVEFSWLVCHNGHVHYVKTGRFKCCITRDPFRIDTICLRHRVRDKKWSSNIK